MDGKIKSQPSICGMELAKLNGDVDLMLESIRDYLYAIEGETDISDFIKNYFKINGYEFNSIQEEEEEEEW